MKLHTATRQAALLVPLILLIVSMETGHGVEAAPALSSRDIRALESFLAAESVDGGPAGEAWEHGLVSDDNGEYNDEKRGGNIAHVLSSAHKSYDKAPKFELRYG